MAAVPTTLAASATRTPPQTPQMLRPNAASDSTDRLRCCTPHECHIKCCTSHHMLCAASNAVRCPLLHDLCLDPLSILKAKVQHGPAGSAACIACRVTACFEGPLGRCCGMLCQQCAAAGRGSLFLTQLCSLLAALPCALRPACPQARHAAKLALAAAAHTSQTDGRWDSTAPPGNKAART